jgi:hypothetical protein
MLNLLTMLLNAKFVVQRFFYFYLKMGQKIKKKGKKMALEKFFFKLNFL